jgi:hypothetical protein
MSHHPKVRDPQNPYRTGVLISNHVEDRFGQDLAAEVRQGTTGITEAQAKLNVHSSMLAVNAGKQPITQQDILVSSSFQVTDKRFRMTKSSKTTKRHSSIVKSAPNLTCSSATVRPRKLSRTETLELSTTVCTTGSKRPNHSSTLTTT